MERLTFDGTFCDIAQCKEFPCPYNGSCSQREVWEKLKAYEATGLEPEVCVNYKAFEDEAISKGVTFKRIVALMEADSTGRLVVRPYRICETVYVLLQDGAIFYPETNGWYISEEVIGAISPDGFYLGDPVDDVYTPDSEIGKTVFLTREEAENALEAMKDG